MLSQIVIHLIINLISHCFCYGVDNAKLLNMKLAVKELKLADLLDGLDTVDVKHLESIHYHSGRTLNKLRNVFGKLQRETSKLGHIKKLMNYAIDNSKDNSIFISGFPTICEFNDSSVNPYDIFDNVFKHLNIRYYEREIRAIWQEHLTSRIHNGNGYKVEHPIFIQFHKHRAQQFYVNFIKGRLTFNDAFKKGGLIITYKNRTFKNIFVNEKRKVQLMLLYKAAYREASALNFKCFIREQGDIVVRRDDRSKLKIRNFHDIKLIKDYNQTLYNQFEKYTPRVQYDFNNPFLVVRRPLTIPLNGENIGAV